MATLIYELVIAFFVASMSVFAYKRPDSYSVLLTHIRAWLIRLWSIISPFGCGIHFTFWQLKLPYKADSLYSYLIANYAYFWGTGLVLLLFFILLKSIGKLFSYVKYSHTNN
ncbi:hypothetical protein [Colwellia echini]|uniref:Uncharacterized protein n=1 Tax=Colwellia echini TaxID=1982103 RepID=A0ABY3N1D3_9GAMM|nr:hypothetical protein [Colwellia echini]TYK67268.1 hypothetical protein CWS31_001730 [Colwellia echini]